MKTKYLIGIGALVIIVLIVYKLTANKKIINEKNNKAIETAIQIPVKVDTAMERSVQVTISKIGSIAPFKEVKALALNGGVIHQVNFELGDEVKEGQVLAVMDMRTLRLDLQKAETNASKLKNDLDVYTELLQGKAATQEKANEIRKNYEDALNELGQVKRTMDDASIKAPISGILSTKSVESGMFINTGGEIATIVSLYKAKVVVNVTESEVYQLTQGQSVKIKTDVFPSSAFSGRVSFISPQADATLSYKVEITMENTGSHLLRSGTSVNVEFSKNTTEKMILIPRDALVESVQKASVYVITGGIVHQKSIVTGKEVGTSIQVIEGLNPGDLVVTSGQINLEEGSQVRITR